MLSEQTFSAFFLHFLNMLAFAFIRPFLHSVSLANVTLGTFCYTTWNHFHFITVFTKNLWIAF